MENYFKSEIEQAVEDFQGMSAQKFCDEYRDSRNMPNQSSFSLLEEVVERVVDLADESNHQSFNDRNSESMLESSSHSLFEKENNFSSLLQNDPQPTNRAEIQNGQDCRHKDIPDTIINANSSDPEQLNQEKTNEESIQVDLNQKQLDQGKTNQDDSDQENLNQEKPVMTGEICEVSRGTSERELSEAEQKSYDNDQTLDELPMNVDGSRQQENEFEYVVERILDKKTGDDGKTLYQIKWENYDSKHNTWEPIENLIGCERTIERFELEHTEKLIINIRREQSKVSGKTLKMGPKSRRGRPMPMSRIQDYEIDEILGLTKFHGEKFFLISLVGGRGTSFMRASIANAVFPSKVIDFYIKHLCWKTDTT